MEVRNSVVVALSRLVVATEAIYLVVKIKKHVRQF
jgi:hypothetical protein